MRHGIILAAAIPLSACAGTASFSTFSTTAGSQPATSGESRPATVPDVVLMTRAQAEAALRSAGFFRPLELDSSACGSTLDEKADKIIIELGQICYQHPAAGRTSSTGLPITVRIQHEDPRRGQYSSSRAWFLMPDLRGLPVEVAKAKLRELGFTSKEPKIYYVQAPGCKPGHVCATRPEPLHRADTTSDKLLDVGLDPAAPSPRDKPQPPPEAADKPTMPTEPAKPTEPTRPDDIF